MKYIKAIAGSSFAALAIQPVVLLFWFVLPLWALGADLPWGQVGLVCFMSVVLALPFVMAIGIPLALLLQKTGQIGWVPMALAGTFAGAAFAGWNLPGGDPGYSSGGNWYGKSVDFIVEGQPTLYGWLNYIQSVVAFGLHGLAGASAFYLVWVRGMGSNNSSKPTPLRDAA